LGSSASILAARLRNQRLSDAPFATAPDVVSWFGAIQAQEYAQTKWALAIRMQSPSDAVIEQAFADGAILRTHVLRPTWHFVAPADIRWMLALTGPRVQARLAPYNRHFELDASVYRRSRNAIARALRGGAQLTRQELKAVLNRTGVQADGVQRLAFLVMQAELDAVICSGARRDDQFTYALLDERVPVTRPLLRDEALAKLARRYVSSHGPAQLRDLVWWSGLTTADARAGLEMAGAEIAQDLVNGKTYYFPSSMSSLARTTRAYLLPLYDEYLIAYRDRSDALDASRWKRITSRDPFSAPIVLDGKVVGGWKRKLKEGSVVITLTLFAPLARTGVRAITQAAGDYASFLGLTPEVVWGSRR
jgi:hypothetical protein